MGELSDAYFDIAILDPEYGIGESSKNHKSRNTPIKQKNGATLKSPNNNYVKKNWDALPANDEYGKEIFRVSKNQIIWGANFFDWIVEKPFEPPRRKDFDKFLKENPKGWILWDKCNGTSDQYDCELAWTSFDRPSFIYQYMWAGMMQGSLLNPTKQEGNKRLNEKRYHPTQKPRKLYRWMILNYCLKGYSIFDSGFGSGNIAFVVRECNRIDKLQLHLTACEKEKDYFDSAVSRLKNTDQLALTF
tara:strand:+ start:3171 stop:3908 length:738 start_codon:yes stop_codon:yes gene_type:complete